MLPSADLHPKGLKCLCEGAELWAGNVSQDSRVTAGSQLLSQIPSSKTISFFYIWQYLTILIENVYLNRSPIWHNSLILLSPYPGRRKDGKKQWFCALNCIRITHTAITLTLQYAAKMRLFIFLVFFFINLKIINALNHWKFIKD